MLKLYFAIFAILLSVSIANSEQIAILMYHHIEDGKSDLRLSPDIFKNHLDSLETLGYQTITFKDVRGGIKYKKPIILTFDDGVGSHWFAFDALQKRKMKGVFFIVHNFIGYGKYLNAYQLGIMGLSGMEIGSHGIKHLNLARAKTEQVEYEINESKEKLERLLHTSIITFCIPYGRYDNRTLKILERSNYHYARTTNEGISNFGKARNFELKIIYIHNYTRDLNKEIARASRE